MEAPEVQKEKESKSMEEQQLAIMKKQLWYSRLSSIFVIILAVVLSVAVITLAPKMNQILKDLQEITSELKDEDLQKMIDNINELTETSQKGVEQATEKLNDINLDELNEAISDLNSVVAPLAKFFGK